MLGYLLALLMAASPEVRVVTEPAVVIDAVRAHRDKHVVVLTFWATWCDACREEFPGIVRLATKLKGLGVVSVSVDDKATLDTKVLPFLGTHGASFPSLLLDLAEPEPMAALVDEKWNGSIPATFIYDRTGKLVRSYVGGADEAALAAVLKELVARK